MTKKLYEEDFNEYLNKGGLPCVDVTINKHNFVFLIDSGSDLSYIDSNIAEDLMLCINNDVYTDVTTINNSMNGAVTYTTTLHLPNSEYTIEKVNLVGIEVNRTTADLEVPFNGIIGVDILRRLGATISFSDNKMTF